MNTADTPLNSTLIAPVNALPLITTDVPAGPVVGVKLLIVGLTLNAVVDVALPAGLLTVIGPVSAPFGTVAWIWFSEMIENRAETPPKETPVAARKPDPLIVTFFPTLPSAGVNDVIVGGTVSTLQFQVAEVESPDWSVSSTTNECSPSDNPE